MARMGWRSGWGNAIRVKILWLWQKVRECNEDCNDAQASCHEACCSHSMLRANPHSTRSSPFFFFDGYQKFAGVLFSWACPLYHTCWQAKVLGACDESLRSQQVSPKSQGMIRLPRLVTAVGVLELPWHVLHSIFGRCWCGLYTREYRISDHAKLGLAFTADI